MDRAKGILGVIYNAVRASVLGIEPLNPTTGEHTPTGEAIARAGDVEVEAMRLGLR